MSQRSGQPLVATVLVISGITAIVAGVALAVAVEPLLGLIALAGVLDLVFAWAFKTGELASARPSPEIADELAPGDASQDPSYNPYARED